MLLRFFRSNFSSSF